MHPVQGANLAGDYPDYQPGITRLDQDNPLARTQGDTTDDLHSALAKAFAASDLAGQPSGAEQQGDNEDQRQHGLDVSAESGAGAVGRMGQRRKQKNQEAQQDGTGDANGNEASMLTQNTGRMLIRGLGWWQEEKC